MKTLFAVVPFIALVSTAALAEPPAKDGGHAAPGAPMRDRMKGRMDDRLSSLPPEKAELVRKGMQKTREANKPRAEQMKTLRDEQRALMKAEKFDRAAYLEKAKKISDLRQASEMQRAENIAETASKLNAQERASLAEGFKQPHPMGMMEGHGENAPAAGGGKSTHP